MDTDRLDDLISRHFEGMLTEAESRELDALVGGHPEAAVRLARASRREVDLSAVHGRSAPALPLLPGGDGARGLRRSTGRRRLFAVAAAAGAAVAAGVLIWFSMRDGDGIVRGRAGEESVRDGVTVAFATDGSFREMDSSGGPRRIEPLTGALDIQVARGAAGVAVATPEGLLRDIGTVFRVDRGQGGQPTEVAVREGLVQFEPRSGPGYVLDAGGGRVHLSSEGSVGAVRERRGTLLVRPRGAQRFRLLREGDELKPGDWVRTGSRGAHAGRLLLRNGTELTLGPGASIEIESPSAVNLVEGEMAIVPGGGAALRYAAGPAGSGTAGDPCVIGLRGGSAVRLAGEPAWLAALRADQAPPMGALIAEVDGRNVALSMGYHKVAADIRDQIARTVVEESFVNHTDSVLEGQFLFPLPEGASVSGFALWIGNELVEGEIVEKQRAREIFETLMHEKRDPALLEWTGGNVFKARVYPIPARGEKRIRISYTEVLEGRGGSFRYRYPLASEMLRNTPLRELDIRVTIASARSIRSVACPSHGARIETGTRAARVEFNAREYSAERDFEIVVEMEKGDDSPLVLSHLRDDEGYLLIRMDGPPLDGRDGEDAPEGGPLDLIVLLDTSHSVRGAARAAQEAFLEAFLGSLAADDRILAGTVDWETRWAFPERRPADGATGAEIAGWHRSRRPLGWSDLRSGFAAAFQRARAGTRVIYLGDGIPSGRFETPAETLDGIVRQLPSGVRVHTVALGSETGATLLDGLAARSGGTRHSLPDAGRAAELASEVLDSILDPGVEDLAIRFEGGAVAAVHPDRIPVLGRGSQAWVLGRFDPALGAPGRLVIEGRRGADSFRRQVELVIDPQDAGNSFIPRLWARRRLDRLLSESGTPAVREQIIYLSEEFQIITPYTSFLVLETEEDRRRFQVEKRLRMRDGEDFFAQAREDATLELRSKQIQLARAWRTGERRALLAELESLGRPARADRSVYFRDSANLGREYAGAVPEGRVEYLGMEFAPTVTGAFAEGLGEEAYQFGKPASGEWSNEEANLVADHNEDFEEQDFLRRGRERLEGEEVVDARRRLESLDVETARRAVIANSLAPMGSGVSEGRLQNSLVGFADGGSLETLYGDAGWFAGIRSGRRIWVDSQPAHSLNQLFPVPPLQPRPVRPSLWPEEARLAVEALDRRAALAGAREGLALRIEEVPKDREGARPLWRLVAGPDGWFTLALDREGEPAALDWLRDGRRGRLAPAWRLGRTRKADGNEARTMPAIAPLVLEPDALTREDFQVELRRESGEEALLVLRKGFRRIEIRIDTARALPRERREFQHGILASRIDFEAPVAKGGLSLPSRIRFFDREGVLERELRLSIEEISEEARPGAWSEARSLMQGALFLDQDAKDTPADVRAALAANGGSLSQIVQLFDYEASAQRTGHLEDLMPALARAIEGAAGASRVLLQAALARGDDLDADRIHGELTAGLGGTSPAALSAARDLVSSRTATTPERRHRALDALQPLFFSRSEEARLFWLAAAEQALRDLQRPAEALQLVRRRIDVATDRPEERALRLASALVRSGQAPEAIVLLESALESAGEPGAKNRLYDRLTGVLVDSYRVPAAAEACRRWSEEIPRLVPVHGYGRLLDAHFMTGRGAEALALMSSWCAGVPEPGDDAGVARLGAVADAFSRNRLGLAAYLGGHPAELESRVLALVEGLLDRPDLFAVLRRILGATNAGGAEAGRELLRRRALDLAEEAPGGDPAFIAAMYEVLRDGGVDGELLDGIRRALLDRFRADPGSDPDRTIRDFFARFGKPEEAEQLYGALAGKTSHSWLAGEARRRQFHGLLRLPWNVELEERMAALMAGLPADEAAPGVAPPMERAGLWQSGFDWMHAGRVRAATEELAADPSIGPRRRREVLADARKESSVRLAAIAGSLHGALPADAIDRDWAHQEHLYWRARAGETVATEAVDAVAALLADGLPGPESPRASILDRAFPAALAACLDDRANEAHRTRLVETVRTAAPGDSIGEVRRRSLLHAALLAFDRREELRGALESWFDGGTGPRAAVYGPALARALADGDRLEEAVATLERTHGQLSLEARDWLLLSGWRLALGDGEGARQARRAGYGAASLESLIRVLNRDAARVARTGGSVPEDLEEEVVERLEAAISKDRHRWRTANLLHSLYGATKDFRLVETILGCLVQVAEDEAFHRMEAFRETVGLIQEEAAVDRLSARAQAVLEDGAGPGASALHVLEAIVRGRAADQGRGGAPHREAAIAALDAVASGPFDEAGAVRRAAALEEMASLRDPSIREKLHRVMAALHGRTAPGGELRMRAARHRAAALHACQRLEDAISVMASALDELRDPGSGPLPVPALGDLETLAAWMREAGRHREAAELIDREASSGGPPERLSRVRLAVFRHGIASLRDGATLPSGKGESLYIHIRDRIDREHGATSEEYASALVRARTDLAEAAISCGISGALDDLLDFAGGRLPSILDHLHYRSGQAIVAMVAAALQRCATPLETLRFLVTRFENEPPYLHWWNQSFFDSHWRSMERCIEKLDETGALETMDPSLDRRLGAMLCRQIEWYLLTSNWRMPSLADGNHRLFRKSHRDAFIRTATGLPDRYPELRHLDMRTASYLFDSLGARSEALDIAMPCLHRGQLDRDDRMRVAGWLVASGRFQEALPVAERLVEEQPAATQPAILKAKALHGAGRQPEALDALEAAAQALADARSLNASACANLAEAAFETGAAEAASRWFSQAIAGQLQTRRAVRGDAALSRWHQRLADALVSQARYGDAIEAAAGAVVVWPPGREQRTEALKHLDAVIERCPDLAAVARGLDEQAAETGREAPILRQALARVLLGRGDPLAAAEQASVAVESGVFDLALSRLLAEAWKAAGREDAAADALWSAVDAFGRTELALAEDLAGLFESRGESQQAERALATLVELRPGEAEGHARFARSLEARGRHGEALDHWRTASDLKREDPAGLVGQLRALVALGRREEAAAVLSELRSTSYGERFGESLREAEEIGRSLDR